MNRFKAIMAGKAVVLVVCGVLILVSFFACDTSVYTPVSPEYFEPAEEEPYAVLFEENENYVQFETNDPVYSQDNGCTVWRVAENQLADGDSFSVDVVKRSGSSTGGFGVLFAAKSLNTFLLFMIDVGGYYTYGRVEEGEFFYAIDGEGESPWVQTNALIRGYGVVNSLRVERVGSGFQLYANDQALVMFTDEPAEGQEPLLEGQLGLLATVMPNDQLPEVPVEVEFSYDQNEVTFPQAQMQMSQYSGVTTGLLQFADDSIGSMGKVW